MLLRIKPNNVSNQTKTYYNLIDDVVIKKHNTIYTNDNINATKINTLVSFHGNNSFTKKIEHTSNITNNTTRHNHNTYEHNVTQKL